MGVGYAEGMERRRMDAIARDALADDYGVIPTVRADGTGWTTEPLGGYPCACGRNHTIPDCWRELGAKDKPNTDALRAAAGLPSRAPRADDDSCYCMGNHSAEEARLYGLHCHPVGLRDDPGERTLRQAVDALGAD